MSTTITQSHNESSQGATVTVSQNVKLKTRKKQQCANQVNATLRSLQVWQARNDFDTVLLGVQEKGTGHKAACDSGFWLGVLACVDRERQTNMVKMVKEQLRGMSKRRDHCMRVLRVLHDVAKEYNIFFCRPAHTNCDNDRYIRSTAEQISNLLRRCRTVESEHPDPTGGRARNEGTRVGVEMSSVLSSIGELTIGEGNENGKHSSSNVRELAIGGGNHGKHRPSSGMRELTIGGESATEDRQSSSARTRKAIRDLSLAGSHVWGAQEPLREVSTASSHSAMETSTSLSRRRSASQIVPPSDNVCVKTENATTESEFNFNDPIRVETNIPVEPQLDVQSSMLEIAVTERQSQTEQASLLSLSIDNLQTRVKEAMTKWIDWTNVPVALFQTEMELRKLSKALEEAKNAYAMQENTGTTSGASDRETPTLR
jgi:hypothetical protein